MRDFLPSQSEDEHKESFLGTAGSEEEQTIEVKNG
jgi:hypothetical protein